MARIDVRITLDLADQQPRTVSRCLGIFEDYCVVTGSVRNAIPVNVLAVDSNGNTLLQQGGIS